VHTRSLLAVPAVATYWPAAQVAQGWQAGALGASVKVPVPQGVQLRSVVALPTALTKLPARQAVCVAHAVAGLASWSQVPALQVSRAAVPPAQYWPGWQASQATGEVAVEGAVLTVPAAQVPASRHIDWLALAL
jgi:hypothetical protein